MFQTMRYQVWWNSAISLRCSSAKSVLPLHHYVNGSRKKIYKFSSSSKAQASIANNKYYSTIDNKMATINNSFLMNHTCLRIKDPKSVDWWQNKLGMKLIATIPFDTFTLYMLNYETEKNKHLNWAAREGVVELCYNHGGTEEINNGNGEKDKGFGHVCISVDNIEAAQEQFLANGVRFKKKLSDGRQHNIAFLLSDPEDYWVEVIENGIDKKENKTDVSSYKLNHTMIRVKDPEASLKFYRSLGFKLFTKKDFPEAKFSLYFLGYSHDPNFKEGTMDWEDQSKRESILELTHNWGTEAADSDFKGYHNGNSTDNGEVQGYGHICISCEDPAKFCQELEQAYGEKLDWSVKFNQGKAVKGIAFIRDPDTYSIEILSHNLFEERMGKL
ncbi:GLO1 [Candida metapsilosis]|uniref:Lactoylglutathione lyase n=1 Tax=Candida metapsilosis TaxID=273372 RepID=A0A8H7ZH98_9ASCO|nr:GLO1 [Candida metapsilosis]